MRKIKSGKVRDIYKTNNENELLIRVSDRVSAFDCILNQNISGKGQLLNLMSYRWFDMMQDIVGNHIVKKGNDFTIVKKSVPLPIECIVRGYLSGTGWLEYKEKQSVCGINLASDLVESSKLPEPIFTASTKSNYQDENISFEKVINILGEDVSNKIKDYSLKIYKRAFDFAYKKGISQPSYDKQIIRDYLLQLGWDKKPPIPDLPQHIISETSKKYQEAYDKL